MTDRIIPADLKPGDRVIWTPKSSSIVTRGKEYRVLDIRGTSIRIFCDDGYMIWASIDAFAKVIPDWPPVEEAVDDTTEIISYFLLPEIEALAACWASIDGKPFDPSDDAFGDGPGHYDGYMAEADELARRLKARGFEIVRADALERVQELETALAFYRDGFSFHPKRGPTGINHSFWTPKEALLEDCGETARAALTKGSRHDA